MPPEREGGTNRQEDARKNKKGDSLTIGMQGQTFRMVETTDKGRDRALEDTPDSIVVTEKKGKKIRGEDRKEERGKRKQDRDAHKPVCHKDGAIRGAKHNPFG